MHLKSDSIEIKINDEADAQHFDSLKNRYQRNLESIKCSEFVFDYLQLLYYIYRKINCNCSGSYINSSDWIKKKATINPINEKDKKMPSVCCNSR